MPDPVTLDRTQRAAFDPPSGALASSEVAHVDGETPAAGVFDYATLPAECAAEVRTVAERIRTRTALAVIETGRDLIRVRELPAMRGRFGAWCTAEFGMSRQTAYRMIQVAENLGGLSHSETISPTVLYAIAAPSTPEPVRAEVETRAAAGERISVAEVERLKREAGAAEEIRLQLEGERAAMRAVAEQARRDVESAKAKAARARAAAEDAVRQAREDAEQAARDKAEALADQALARRRDELAEVERRAAAALDAAQAHQATARRWAADAERHREYLARASSIEREAPEQIEAADTLIAALAAAMIALHGFEHAPAAAAAQRWDTARQMSAQLAEAIAVFLAPTIAQPAPRP